MHDEIKAFCDPQLIMNVVTTEASDPGNCVRVSPGLSLRLIHKASLSLKGTDVTPDLPETWVEDFGNQRREASWQWVRMPAPALPSALGTS